MKKSKKILALILSAIILCSCFGVAANAGEYTNAWSRYYNTIDNKLPYLSPGANESEMYLTWHSAANSPTPSVKVSLDPLMLTNVVEFVAKTSEAEVPEQRVNRCLITGLKENTTYFYSYILDNGSYSSPEYFTTGKSNNFTILYTTDTQIGAEKDGADKIMDDSYIWGNIITTAKNNRPEINFIVHGGDETQTGVDANEWTGFYAPSILRNVPVATIIGNHDKKGLMYKYYATYPNAYESIFSNELGNDYWFTYGNTVFVVFDSTCGDTDTHYAVAKEATLANPNAKWLVGVMHHDLYGGTDSAGQAESTILFKSIFGPIFDDFDFDVVLTGHSHSYSRSKQMYKALVAEYTTNVSAVTNPKGTVYISGMCTGNKFDDYDNELYDWTAYRYEERDYAYTTLTFNENELDIRTEKLDKTLIDEYVITKTSEVEKPDNNLENDPFFLVVKALSAIYMACSKIYKAFEK